jgi:hypothetical protein
MRIHRLSQSSGEPYGFEVSNGWLQPRAAARLLRSKGAEITFRRKFLRPGNIHLKFRYKGFDFELFETFGDSDCYEIVPVHPANTPPAPILELQAIFEQYRPTPLGIIRSIFGG